MIIAIYIVYNMKLTYKKQNLLKTMAVVLQRYRKQLSHNIFSVKNTTISEIKCTNYFFPKEKKAHSIKENMFFFKNRENSLGHCFSLQYNLTQNRNRIALTPCSAS